MSHPCTYVSVKKLTLNEFLEVMKTIRKNGVDYKIIPYNSNGEKYYTVKYFGTEKVVTKSFLGFPIKKKLKTGWFDVEVDVGSVDFCIMTPKKFDSEKQARKWILK